MAAGDLGKGIVPFCNDLMIKLEANDDFRRTATGIFMQMAWGAGGTIAGCVVGGLVSAVGGRVGAMAGGLAGSVMGYCMSNEYQPITRALAGLTYEDKWQLFDLVLVVAGWLRKAPNRFNQG